MSQDYQYITPDYNCGFPCTTCTESDTGCLYPSYTDCVTYKSGTLPNLGLPVSPETTVDLTTIIKKIDEKIGILSSGTSVDWSTYNVHCLSPVATQKDFVEKISLQFCTLQTDYTTFSGTTYVTDQTAQNTRISALEVPALTSSGCLGILSTDSQKQIDTKIISKVESICTSNDISSIVWNNCITTSSTPSTIKEGIEELLSQICTVKGLINSSGQDTYKVIVSSADTTPDYISNKITTSQCLTSSITSDNKLKIGLSFTPKNYSFDSTYFEVVEGTTGTCSQDVNITLKDTPGTGTVTYVNITSDDMDITGSPISSSGSINANLKTVLGSPGNFNNVTVNSKGLITGGSLVSYLTSESDPTVPSWVKSITETDITNWNNNVTPVLPVASTSTLGAIKVGNGLEVDSNDSLNGLYNPGYGIVLDSNYKISLSSTVQTSLSKADTSLQNITGYISAGSNISISGSGTIANPYQLSASTGSTSITSNSFNYGKTSVTYDGFSTNGGFASSPIVYVDNSAGSGVIPIPQNAHHVVIIGGSETQITIPDPTPFIGRIIKLKIKNITNPTILQGSYVYNGTVPVHIISTTGDSFVLLEIKSSYSSLMAQNVWELITIGKVDSALYT